MLTNILMLVHARPCRPSKLKGFVQYYKQMSFDGGAKEKKIENCQLLDLFAVVRKYSAHFFFICIKVYSSTVREGVIGKKVRVRVTW